LASSSGEPRLQLVDWQRALAVGLRVRLDAGPRDGLGVVAPPAVPSLPVGYADGVGDLGEEQRREFPLGLFRVQDAVVGRGAGEMLDDGVELVPGESVRPDPAEPEPLLDQVRLDRLSVLRVVEGLQDGVQVSEAEPVRRPDDAVTETRRSAPS
jgi:hypothetical protein